MGKTSSLALLALKWVKGTGECFLFTRINRIRAPRLKKRGKFSGFRDNDLFGRYCYIQFWPGQPTLDQHSVQLHNVIM